MATSDDLRQIFAAGRPLIEEWLDIGEQIAALRDVAASKGLDWSQLKALMKAQIQDERDETGSGKRVARIVEKAEFASAYADMLGLANMNEKNFSEASQSYAEVKGINAGSSSGRIAEFDSADAGSNPAPVITEHEQPETARNEPEAAAEVAGDYLREPVAAGQGQIIREGDASRETDRFGGDASCPDTECSNPPAPSSQDTAARD